MPTFLTKPQAHALAVAISSSLTPYAAAQSIETLVTIEVRSAAAHPSLQALPTSATLLDVEQLRDGQMQVNLSEILGAVPGLQIKNRQNYAQDLQLSVRGFGARSTFGVRGVRLYVDAIPATMPDGQGSLSHIDITSLERVEVLRGPYSALYGNSAGGVVSMFTETPEHRPAVTGSVASGSNGQRRLSTKASGQTPQGLSYLLSASGYTTDGYREHSAADRTIANAKLSTAIDDGARLTIVANTMKSDAQDPQGQSFEEWQKNPRSVSANTRTYKARKTLEQTQVGVTYERHLDAVDSLALTVYTGHRSMEQYQSIPSTTQSSNPGHAGAVIDMSRDYAGVDARWTRSIQQTPVPVTVTAGLSLDYMKEDRYGYENFKGSIVGVKGALRRDEKNTITNIDPYVQATWQLTPNWRMDTGLRYSRVNFESGDHYIRAGNSDDSGKTTHRKALPVVSLLRQFTPNATAYASAGRGFETPTFTELSYSNDGSGLNSSLQPSESTQYEMGYRQRLTGSIKGMWSAAVFHSSTSDEIVSDIASGGRTTYRNAGKTRRQGAELQADFRLTPMWQVEAAYTYLSATFRHASGDAAAGNMLPGLSDQQLFVAVNYKVTPEWRLGLSTQHVGKVFVNDANSASAPAFTVAAADLGYITDLGSWTLNAFTRVDNLFDRQYVGSVIVNDNQNKRYYEGAPGRNWSTGVNLRYNF